MKNLLHLSIACLTLIGCEEKQHSDAESKHEVVELSKAVPMATPHYQGEISRLTNSSISYHADTIEVDEETGRIILRGHAWYNHAGSLTNGSSDLNSVIILDKFGFNILEKKGVFEGGTIMGLAE